MDRGKDVKWRRSLESSPATAAMAHGWRSPPAQRKTAEKAIGERRASRLCLLPLAHFPTFHTASLRLSHSLQWIPHPLLRSPPPPPPPLPLSRAPSTSPRSGLTRTGACAPRTSTTPRSVPKVTRSWPIPVALTSLPLACAASAIDACRASTITQWFQCSVTRCCGGYTVCNSCVIAPSSAPATGARSDDLTLVVRRHALTPRLPC
jgi:hypothetical protein